ncbi:MAG: SprT family zinc-dependent metalloprotease [bacterium]|nr:SprT family zinc-dependent metalloprotease [bacterium]
MVEGATMERQIRVKNARIRYAVKRTSSVKSPSLRVYRNGRFVVLAPLSMRYEKIQEFLRSKADWLLEQYRFFRRFQGRLLFTTSKDAYLNYKEEARAFVKNRLDFYKKIYRVSPNQVRIKNHKVTWGSCSENGNLNFNYKLLFLPRRLANYLVVHELCHLREFNHSPKFWKLVEQTFPDYHQLEQELRYRY